MAQNLKLVLAYDGTEFHGWQRQAGVRTVQETLETVLARVLRHPACAHGASRTDAGVHARGQVANVLTESSIPPANILRAIGCRLPPDVALLHVAPVPLQFHASALALGKLYRYRIHAAVTRPTSTLAQRFAWHIWYPLDLDRLHTAAALLVGTHDFAGFASQGSPRSTTIRTIRHIDVRRCLDEVRIDVAGDGFLYNQVRNIVGTLIEVARGHWPPERIAEILASRDRRLAGPTAPPHGLCLQWVRYPSLRSLTDGPA